MIEPTIEEFESALPWSGWTVTIADVESMGRSVRQVVAAHDLFGCVILGPKLRLVPRDIQALADLVQDVEAPRLTHTQWLASGQRQGFTPPVLSNEREALLARSLRLLAICIERGDVQAFDVAQAMLRPGDYTVDCPVKYAVYAASTNARELVTELHDLLARTANEFGIRLQSTEDDDLYRIIDGRGHEAP